MLNKPQMRDSAVLCQITCTGPKSGPLALTSNLCAFEFTPHISCPANAGFVYVWKIDPNNPGPNGKDLGTARWAFSALYAKPPGLLRPFSPQKSGISKEYRCSPMLLYAAQHSLN